MKAHEVIVLSTGKRYFVKKYIIIEENTSKAVALVPLRDGDEVLEAREFQNHQVILGSQHEHST